MFWRLTKGTIQTWCLRLNWKCPPPQVVKPTSALCVSRLFSLSFIKLIRGSSENWPCWPSEGLLIRDCHYLHADEGSSFKMSVPCTMIADDCSMSHPPSHRDPIFSDQETHSTNTKAVSGSSVCSSAWYFSSESSSWRGNLRGSPCQDDWLWLATWWFKDLRSDS